MSSSPYNLRRTKARALGSLVASAQRKKHLNEFSKDEDTILETKPIPKDISKKEHKLKIADCPPDCPKCKQQDELPIPPCDCPRCRQGLP
jgi:predicted Zn-ribbon and HTH transcriptional regulator